MPGDVEAQLRDGTVVLVRPVRPDDADRFRAAFERLSQESRYRRFLAPTPRLPLSAVRYLTEVDHHDHEALVAVEPRTGDGVASARYVRDADAPHEAEAAVTVIDAWQGRGLGTVMLELLALRAVQVGVTHFCASVLADNRAAVRSLAHLGPLRQHHDGAALQLSIELEPEGVCAELREVLRVAATAAPA
jgi:GNAT superfamily N-acetyltransferase